MKSKILIIALLFILTSSYQNNTTYSIVDYSKRSNENEQCVEIEFFGLNFPFSVVCFKESEKSFILVNEKQSFLVDLELNFNDSLKLNTENVLLFKRENEYLLMLPTYSEEFPTFQLVEFNKAGTFHDFGFHTFSYDDIKTINNVADIQYDLKEKDNLPRIYTKSTPKILLSKVELRKNKVVTISKYERIELDRLRKFVRHKNLITKNWEGNYYSTFEIIRGMEEYKFDYTFKIKDENNVSLQLLINSELSFLTDLYIDTKHSSEIELILKSNTDKDLEYIIYRKNNRYSLSGLSIYLLNPPNNEYEIIKR